MQHTPRRRRAIACAYAVGLWLLQAGGAAAQISVSKDDGGVWWFAHAGGERFLAKSVVHVTFDGDTIGDTTRRPYREAVEASGLTKQTWRERALGRIRAWGFNSAGAWGDGEVNQALPYTLALNFQNALKEKYPDKRPILDVFDARFEADAKAYAERACKPRRSDTQLIGYFSDNELRWGPDWRGKEELLHLYLALPTGTGGRKAADQFLKDRYPTGPRPTAATVREADIEQFAGVVAERYFRVVAAAIRAADPNHLYLGARFQAVVAPRDAVIRGAAVADVVSVNLYARDPSALTQRIHVLTGKPVLVSEFAFRARDAGLPNTKGAGPLVDDQNMRAAAYRYFVNRLTALPWAVGYQWFQWADEPRQGRKGGEDSNFGLVTIEDKPYSTFVQGVAQANRAADDIHRGSQTSTATSRAEGPAP